MTEQQDTSASEAVDRLIEARRRGETSASTPGPARKAADLAGTLEDQWRQQPIVDEDAIWQRVHVGMRATPQGPPRRWPRLPSALAAFTFPAALPASLIGRTPAFVTAALAVVLVVLATFTTQRDSANATFVTDVENLASFTAAVLNDRQLSPRERGEVERRASGLLSTVQANPSVLAELDGSDAELVVSRIDGILTLLEPYEDDEHGGVETSIVPLASVRDQVEHSRSDSSPVGAFSADTSTPSPAPTSARAAATAEVGTPTAEARDTRGPRRSPNVPPTPRATATVEAAGLSPAATPPLESDTLRDLCGEEREPRQGRCRAAMAQLASACDRGERAEERCEEALEDALEACRELRHDDAAVSCERALLALAEAFPLGGADGDDGEDNGPNRLDDGDDNSGPGDRGGDGADGEGDRDDRGDGDDRSEDEDSGGDTDDDDR